MNTATVLDVFKGRVPTESEVTVQGWIRTRRDSKAGISFLTIYDGSCFDALQAVANNTLLNYHDEVLRLTAGCSVSISGQLINSIGKNQNYEIQVKTIKVLGWVEDPNSYPIAPKRHSLEHLRDVAHLRPRTNLIGAVTRIRHTLAQSIHRFMNEKGFFWVSTPLITASNSEGTGDMFRVSTLDLKTPPQTPDGKCDFHQDFFGKETFLTVSGQLNAESYACALSKVYTFGPIFRAENSNTSRHLAEFWMVEVEFAFANLTDIIDLSKSMLKYLFQSVLTECEKEMQFLSQTIDKQAIKRLERFINTDLIQIDYSEAIQLLKNCDQKFELSPLWGGDLSGEHERYLSEVCFKAPVVIKNYPKDLKAFYMRINEDGKTVAAMDILAPGIGEIIGGSQREERLDYLDKRLEEKGLNQEDYWWYRDLRRYGTVSHSGFGLGLERLIIYVTGMKNVRDVIPFPRSPRTVNF
ncbi:asparaginyl-tRNA synthetase [secondary endosymbiont of Heteropsylla cubana]|uniref:Asparagine--tRNA ligase n=1 Tax=secondary endosymbiont of Heteropsylla cubana TaxID=134287 RepID=J3VTT4_9ENTR|nr:asparagine--tRNA ligase [secondary endosymbiont of Heteropsylla cubana]AFP85416.1 asparaginyl-tRNA synthetase [secondary endosymbiont of Heteropsylla cubana]